MMPVLQIGHVIGGNFNIHFWVCFFIISRGAGDVGDNVMV